MALVSNGTSPQSLFCDTACCSACDDGKEIQVQSFNHYDMRYSEDTMFFSLPEPQEVHVETAPPPPPPKTRSEDLKSQPRASESTTSTTSGPSSPRLNSANQVDDIAGIAKERKNLQEALANFLQAAVVGIPIRVLRDPQAVALEAATFKVDQGMQHFTIERADTAQTFTLVKTLVARLSDPEGSMVQKPGPVERRAVHLREAGSTDCFMVFDSESMAEDCAAAMKVLKLHIQPKTPTSPTSSF
jgi:hypothetical protein